MCNKRINYLAFIHMYTSYKYIIIICKLSVYNMRILLFLPFNF